MKEKESAIVLIIEVQNLLENNNFTNYDLKEFEKVLLQKKDKENANNVIIVLQSLNFDDPVVIKSLLSEIGSNLKRKVDCNLKVYVDVSYNKKIEQSRNINNSNSMSKIENKLKYEVILSNLNRLHKKYDILNACYVQSMNVFNFEELYDANKLINIINDLFNFKILVCGAARSNYTGVYNDIIFIGDGAGLEGITKTLEESQNINELDITDGNYRRLELYSEDKKRRNFWAHNLSMVEKSPCYSDDLPCASNKTYLACNNYNVKEENDDSGLILFYQTNDPNSYISKEEGEKLGLALLKTSEIYGVNKIYFCPVVNTDEVSILGNYAIKSHFALGDNINIDLFLGDGIGIFDGELNEFSSENNDIISKIIYSLKKMNSIGKNIKHVLFSSENYNHAVYVQLTNIILKVESNLPEDGSFSLFVLNSNNSSEEFGIFWERETGIDGVVNTLERINHSKSLVYLKKKKEEDLLPF